MVGIEGEVIEVEESENQESKTIREKLWEKKEEECGGNVSFELNINYITRYYALLYLCSQPSILRLTDYITLPDIYGILAPVQQHGRFIDQIISGSCLLKYQGCRVTAGASLVWLENYK